MAGNVKLMTSAGGGVILDTATTTATDVTVKVPAVNGNVVLTDVAGTVALNATGANIITASTNGSERMRIDSSGNLLVGTTASSLATGVGIKQYPDGRMGCVVNDATTGTNSYHLYNTNATNNGYRFYVNVNGGILNYSGNNTNLSDERTKTNIELSGSYLNKICSIPIKLFNYKDEPEGEQRTLGVIAQDVEAVAPELVSNEGFGETPEGQEPLKSVYTTDLMFALMKCIQELKAELDATKAKLTEVSGEVAALKGAA